MDIARPSQAGKKKKLRIIYGGVGILAILLVTLGLSKLKPAAPTVERGSVWIDTVKRGPMLRQVRGLGTLVPEEIRWIPAETTGRVEKIVLRPGTPVKADTVILVLSNPQVELDSLDANWQLKAAEAETVDLKVRLESQKLDQAAVAATATANQRQARLQADADQTLSKDGLVSDINLKMSQSRAEEQTTRLELEQRRLEISEEAVTAQLAVQEARLEQLRGLAGLKRRQLEALKVKAGIDGVLQQLPVEVGQQIATGAILAKVTVPGKLKAELRIPETQAKDIQIDQPAVVDTRNGVVNGHVARIDPAVENGTVKVDVTFDGPLPKGARPDLSVDGTVELERLADVLQVGRPAFGQEQATVGLFVLDASGREANRVQVKLGKSSVNVVEIVEGLKEGDKVILSDTSAWDAHDRLRID
ncbi:MAG TPA: HlyD family efflux transporter periplasmic adaptor subunit [Candidatus Polarisedimenticolia bacterium]|nr:HlyD family efflux transporter periplasmic adaptor subunit [Candidatus Polarisedimenticolia bacterium]